MAPRQEGEEPRHEQSLPLDKLLEVKFFAQGRLRLINELFVVSLAAEGGYPVVELFDRLHTLVVCDYIVCKPLFLLFVSFEIIVKIGLFPVFNARCPDAISLAEH